MTAANECPKYGGQICKDEAGALCECYPGTKAKREARFGVPIGYVVVEQQNDGSFDLMLGTPMFEPDDRVSAEACLAGEAFVAEVRRV
jgi:hypothetical protein